MKEISAVDLLRMVHPDPQSWICIGGIPAKDVHRGYPLWYWIERREVAQYLGKLKQANTRGRKNIYYSMARFRPGVEAKGAREKGNVQGIQVLWLDFDGITEASEAFWKGESWRDIPTPNIGVNTSPGHAQFFWVLESPLQGAEIEDEGGLEGLLKGLTRATGADIAAVDVSRVMRLLGYANLNRGAFEVRGYLLHSRRCSMGEYDALKERYSRVEGPGPLCDRREPAEPSGEPCVTHEGFGTIGRVAQMNARERWNATVSGGKSPSEADWAVLGYLHAVGGVSTADMESFLRMIHPGKHDGYYEYTVEKFQRKIALGTSQGGKVEKWS